MERVPVIGLAHVGVRVHDLTRARAFYELLGFQFVAGPLGPEPVAILHHPSGVELNLILNATHPDARNVLMDGPEKHPGITHFALRVADLDETRRVLAEANIPLSGDEIFPNGHRAVFVRDPDRNVVELHFDG